MLARTLSMANGKNEQQLQQIARNMAHSSGMDDTQFSQFISMFNNGAHH